MSAPGLLLSGRYRLNRRIAVGGMGEVWSADDIRLARIVALKILRPELTGDPEFVERFRTEARITASLNHPGIASVYDYGEVGGGAGPYLSGTAYLVMELIAGESLSAVLARTGRLSVPRTLDVLDQTGRALQHAHTRSLVHRDIKPGNLLITPGGQVKITDFGIAKVAHQAPVTRMGMVMGTAQYISPEQAAGQEAVPASDIYSLGVVAYECLAGTLPFPNENAVAMALAHVRDTPRPLPPDIPPAVAALVMQMLVKDPTARFANGAALAQAVTQVRGGGGRSGDSRSSDGRSGDGRSGDGRSGDGRSGDGRSGDGRGAAATARPAVRTRAVPVTPAQGPPARRAAAPVPARPNPATRVQPAVSPPMRRPAAAGPGQTYGPGTVTAHRTPPPAYPAARPSAPSRPPAAPAVRQRSNRRTGLSVLLAVIVLVLAGLVLIVVNQVVGELSATAVLPAGAAAVPFDASPPATPSVGAS